MKTGAGLFQEGAVALPSGASGGSGETGASEIGTPSRSRALTGLGIRGLLLCVAYYLGTWLGYALIFPGSYISIIWPPNTVLLISLLLWPRRRWPLIFLVAYPAHLVAQAQFGVQPKMASLYYLFDIGLLLVVAGALCAFGLDRLNLGELRQAMKFIGVTTIATAVGTLIWSPLMVRLVVGGDPWESWSLVFLSNLLPFLVATPGLVPGLLRSGRLVRNASLSRLAEFALLALGLLACAVAAFALAPHALESLPALFYAPLPFLLWATVRFGPGGLSFGFLGFAVMAMFGTIAGHGLFVGPTPWESVLQLQFFLLALYVPLLVLASEVAERRSKADALRESETRYRAVVEDQTELICRFLPDGTLTFVNGAFCRHFGTLPENLLGLDLWFAVAPLDRQGARDFFASLAPANAVEVREHELATPNGDSRWMQWRVRAFFDSQGHAREFQAVGHDITERKHTEAAMDGIAHAERLALVGELTGSIAHEINQPLGAILCNAECAELLLNSDAPPLDELRKILAEIRKDDLRASEVIARIRDLLRKREMLSLPLDLNDVAGEVARLALTDAHRRRVEVQTKLAADLPTVSGDRIYLQQVLLNLMLNGMDAMSETPQAERRLVLTTAQDERSSVIVSVSDSGHGIRPDRLRDVFTSFYTTKEHGMGLGLAIARSIIDLHHGRIWASNNPDAGATFSFSLPATRTVPGA